MPLERPFDIYREQLSSQYHGIALWHPNPIEGLYDGRDRHVTIGDVGYLYDGDFVRMFNVTLPWDDPSNKKLGIPMEYRTLQQGYFVNVRDIELAKVEYFSPHVSREENDANINALTPDEASGQTYKCQARGRGALLSLPRGGRRRDAIRTKVFEDYARDNADSWFDWSREMGLPVERMEDLILVTGCTLVTSWAAAVFDSHTTATGPALISLSDRIFADGGAQFYWSNIRGNVEYHSSQYDPSYRPTQNQCVFIRACRAKRTFFRSKYLRTASKPLPDDPNNHRERSFFGTKPPQAAAEPPPSDPKNRQGRTSFQTNSHRAGAEAAEPLPRDSNNGRERTSLQTNSVRAATEPISSDPNNHQELASFQTNHLRAAAGPAPDDPDDPENRRKSDIQGSRVPNRRINLKRLTRWVMDNFEDANAKPDIAIAHDDDLQPIESKNPETFTADAAQMVLRDNPPGNTSPISSQGMWEELNADFHSISGDDMEKWPQDKIVPQEQASSMKGSPSPSTVNLNESTSTINLNESTSTINLNESTSTINLNEGTSTTYPNEGTSKINPHEGSPSTSTISLNEGSSSNLNEGYVSTSTINLNEGRASTSTTNLSKGCASTSTINLNEGNPSTSTINLNEG